MGLHTFKVKKDNVYIPLQEGRYTFRIDKFRIGRGGKTCRGTFSTADGKIHYEKYKLYDAANQLNHHSIKSVACIIAGAMQLDDIPEDFDETDVKKCEGRYIEADIEYSDMDEDDDRIFDHINCYTIEPSDGFTDADYEGEDTDPAEPTVEATDTSKEGNTATADNTQDPAELPAAGKIPVVA